MKTIQTPVYTYDELTPKAQENAREWWKNDDGWLAQVTCQEEINQFLTIAWGNDPQWLKKYPQNVPSLPDIGLSADPEKCHYEIGSYRGTDHITPKNIDVDNPALFCRWLGLDGRNWWTQWIINGNVDLYIYGKTGNYYSARVRVEFDIMDYPDWINDQEYNQRYHKLEEICQEIEEQLNDLMTKACRMIEKTIEDQYSDESAAESLRINEYHFTADGKRKIYID